LSTREYFRAGNGVAESVIIRSRRLSEQGYILLLLMLWATILAITFAAAAPLVAFELKRDREEELIHRGVQYSRAIRRFYKRNGTYPVSLEQLDNTNNVHYLRKHYKDPITGKDFKLLHQQDVKISFGPGLAGANPTGAAPAAGASALAGAAALLNAAAAANSPAVAQNQTQAQDPNQATSSGPSQAVASQGATDTGDKLSATVFGGGPVVGVASTSKDPSIREFNKKDHYNQWQFIYDPNSDRGGLLSTPNQPPLQGAVPNQQPGGIGAGVGGPLPASGTSFGSPNVIPQQNPQPPPQPQQQQ